MNRSLERVPGNSKHPRRGLCPGRGSSLRPPPHLSRSVSSSAPPGTRLRARVRVHSWSRFRPKAAGTKLGRTGPGRDSPAPGSTAASRQGVGRVSPGTCVRRRKPGRPRGPPASQAPALPGARTPYRAGGRPRPKVVAGRAASARAQDARPPPRTCLGSAGPSPPASRSRGPHPSGPAHLSGHLPKRPRRPRF